MSISKEKLVLTNEDINIKINIGGINDLLGIDEEIDNFSVETQKKSINPVSDNEVKTFKHGKTADFIMEFYSLTVSPPYYWSNIFTHAGFSDSEIINYDLSLRNSFFILDFFDTYITNERIKIFTKYYTKIADIGEPYDITQHEKIVQITNNHQLNHIQIPHNFLSNFTEDEITIYMRVLFYNGKTGNLIPFYNIQYFNESENKFTINTEKRMFFTVKLDQNNLHWWVENQDMTNHIHGREFYVDNSEYLEKLNKTNKNIKTIKPGYPIKQYFKYEDGTYVDTA